jgi:5-methylcytosine-specific restriction enzyme subunit McrC
VTRHTLREWEYLPIGDNAVGGEISRRAADTLVAAAKRSGLGGADGETILVNGHTRLRAQQIVGVLVTPAATLEILPKIDGLDEGATRQRLIHMLARVFDLDIASGAITQLGWQNHDLLEVLIRLFCDKLFAVVHRGLPRRYVSQQDDLPALRGRLDVQRQFTLLVASPQRLACRYDDLSADIALNQIMKAAVTRLHQIARASETQRRLSELALVFADVSAVPVRALPWNEVILDRTNSTWASLLALARLLLGDRFQTTSTGAGEGFSLLFEMNTLFEEFIGRTLQRAFAASEWKVWLQGPRDHALLSEDNTLRFATKPDIVISDGQGVRLIIDTKWKRLAGPVDDQRRGVGQADVYQMMAYSQVYSCDRLMLLYPHHNQGMAAEGHQTGHLIRGTTDRRLSIATIGLSELTGLDERLRRLVESIVETPHVAPQLGIVI